MKYAGIDGCKVGWAVASLDESGVWEPVVICPTFADAVRYTAGAELTLVDIPLGLEDRRHLRACDQAARVLLGSKRSSIFPVPVRAAVHAPDYPTASALNCAATGRKLSLQSWHICRKIAEADLSLRADPSIQERLRESHPELCFAVLNGWQPLTFTKKHREGWAERLALLARHAPEPTLPPGLPRSEAAVDDILDAMVLAAAARMASGAPVFPVLPAPPELDAFGLRMEIVLPDLPRR